MENSKNIEYSGILAVESWSWNPGRGIIWERFLGEMSGAIGDHFVTKMSLNKKDAQRNLEAGGPMFRLRSLF